ncbi:hypothetical protein PBT90_16705 [Algoriphagus halophytocola]|uniref:hypothetical protein n=1 Tax=Algoriphagus halophytocola TaxID=2991499 RepID=UPI0022DDECFF|nr:hypothetical protein [Algoriphagus sp. TR-M9]WBL42378.1 hypothetical protein PBT90_16705 [Algoriphagus sp. TR-M9]
MPLFSSSDIKRETIGKKGKIALVGGGKSTHIIAREAAELIHTLQNLAPDQNYHYTTAGAWSLHDMIALASEKIGPAKLYLSTWTITEEPMRVLFQLIQKGLIEELHCLFDYRIEKQKAEAFQLAKVNASRVKLVKIHAKVAILINQDWAITILGSANLTKNPRIEAGVLSSCREVARFHRDWIINEIEHGDTFRK